MPCRPPEYEEVIHALTPVLHDLPGRVIGIDGRDGSGKTTLGRFLAWYFNVSLIETDLFLFDSQGFRYRLEEINRIINLRLSRPRPVIVEGVQLLSLLSQLGRSADFLIYVKNQEFSGSHALSDDLCAYESSHKPETFANFVLKVAH